MTELDRTQQRIIGVLIEKELAVPDSYPMTENTLIAGCNQKSNRDPEMGLEQFEVHGALNALMAADWVKTATSTGSRATRYAHRLDDHYAVDPREKAVLCELLVRGPQAPGALKQRVARLGFQGDPHTIEQVLEGMAQKIVPMAERLPKRPRERDCRWRHLLGAMDPAHEAEAGGVEPAASSSPGMGAGPVASEPAPATATSELEARVAALEAAVAEIRARLGEG